MSWQICLSVDINAFYTVCILILLVFERLFFQDCRQICHSTIMRIYYQGHSVLQTLYSLGGNKSIKNDTHMDCWVDEISRCHNMRFMSCIIFQIICHQNPNEKKKSYPDNNISGDSVKKFCTSQRLSISPFPHLRKVHIFSSYNYFTFIDRCIFIM